MTGKMMRKRNTFKSTGIAGAENFRVYSEGYSLAGNEYR